MAGPFLFYLSMPAIRRQRTKYHDKAPELGAPGASGAARESDQGGPFKGPSSGHKGPQSGPYGAPLGGSLGIAAAKSLGPEDSAALRSRATATAETVGAVGDPTSKGALKATGKGGGPLGARGLLYSGLLNKDITSLSRGQRKRLRKREAAARRKDFGAYAEALLQQQNREEAPPSALDDLNVVREALNEGPGAPREGPPSQNTKKWTCKKRVKAVVKEMQQFDAILQFGAFQSNPAKVLSAHLENGLKAQQQQLQQQQQ